jgi:two-component sensor histidine kinase
MSRTWYRGAVSEPRWSLSRVFTDTVARLTAPRRLVPIAIVVVPLLALQRAFSHDFLALPVGLAMALVFLLAAPTLWRYWFPLDAARSTRRTLAGAMVYLVAGIGLMLAVGAGVPLLIGLGATLLTTTPGLIVSIALFWVGGWGLARDIDLERGWLASQARAAALAREAEHAQLLALRSHFDPHFLFNTLNAIAEWCREDALVAEQAIVALSAMLRTIMTAIHTPRWPLAQELALIDALFQLYLIRDPELFRYRREVEVDPEAIEIPAMLLLPLAENAMKHGPSAGHRGEVALRVVARDGGLELALSNPGGFGGRRSAGHGVRMAERRLALEYGARASLELAGDGPDRTRVVVRLPRAGEAA